MRILFLTHRLPYAPNRGDRIRAYHLLTELARWARVDLVSVVHSKDEMGRASELDALAATVTVGKAHRLRNTFRAGILLPGSTPTTHTMLRVPELIGAVRKLTQQVKHDLVFCYCTGIGPLTSLPCLQKVPVLLDMVDVDSAKWAELAAVTRPPLSWIYKRESRTLADYEARLARRAALTTVVTSRERRTLLDFVPDARVEVLGNGVALDHLRPAAEPKNVPVVVFCGVMNYAPNVDGVEWFVSQVWPSIVQHRPDARFLILGSEPAPRVLRLAGERGVEVSGAVPDVRPFLWSSAVSVAPLLTARGVQNKVLEAVAAGLPVVVTPPVAEGLPDELRSACRVQADPAPFAAEVLALLDLTGVERRAMAGTADLERLSWQNRLAPLRDLLTEVIRRG